MYLLVSQSLIGGLLADTTLGLLDELTNRLPANDRLRFNTFARMKLSATIALGTARLIKERLPIRIGSDGRVLPTGAAAVQPGRLSCCCSGENH